MNVDQIFENERRILHQKPITEEDVKGIDLELLEKGIEMKDHSLVNMETRGYIELDLIDGIFNTDVPVESDCFALSNLMHNNLHDSPKVGDIIDTVSLTIKVKKISKNRLSLIRLKKIQKLEKRN